MATRVKTCHSRTVPVRTSVARIAASTHMTIWARTMILRLGYLSANAPAHGVMTSSGVKAAAMSQPRAEAL